MLRHCGLIPKTCHLCLQQSTALLQYMRSSAVEWCRHQLTHAADLGLRRGALH
jgi:hypothetical protein